MKRIVASVLGLGLILQSCGSQKEAFKHYGPTSVDMSKAISMDEMVKQFNQNPQQDTFTFSAPIVNVCQSAGCWVNVKKTDGDLMRIRFKDHFGIPPKTETGNVAYFHGTAYYDTISVQLQKHFLEDAHAPQSEIDKIVSPRIELNFLSDGVLIPSSSSKQK
ncbi:MAG: DUF4920 domain-containing protein [Flavobacteriales bacterium]